MRHLLALCVVLAAAPVAADPATGTVTGTVVAVKSGKPVKADYLYVYLQPAKLPHYPGRGKTFQIHQKDKQFVPHVLVVPTGSVVEFPNDDDRETHNVFSPNGPPAQFDLGRKNKTDKPASRRFDDAGEVELFCDIHQEMWAKVKVVDTPYIADARTGTFTIAGVAPGTYKVIAWAPSSAEVVSPDKQVTVTAGQTTTAKEIHLQLSPPNTTHVRKDGKPYCPDGYARC
jgi:plastocyanin